MSEYDSYLEPFHSGSFITHAHQMDDPKTLCGLPIASLTTLEKVGDVISLVSCPRCLAFIDAAQTPRFGPEQAWLIGFEGMDG